MNIKFYYGIRLVVDRELFEPLRKGNKVDEQTIRIIDRIK
jgi:hypothetical protein